MPRQSPGFKRIADIVFNLEKINYGFTQRLRSDAYVVRIDNVMEDAITFLKNGQYPNSDTEAEITIDNSKKITGEVNEPVAVIVSGVPTTVRSINMLDGTTKVVAIYVIDSDEAILLNDIEWIDLNAIIDNEPAIEIFHSGEQVTQVRGNACHDVYEQIEEILCNH